MRYCTYMSVPNRATEVVTLQILPGHTVKQAVKVHTQCEYSISSDYPSAMSNYG